MLACYWSPSKSLNNSKKVGSAGRHTLRWPMREKKLKELLDYLSSFRAKHGYERSYDELCKHMRVKRKSTVARYLAELEQRRLWPKERPRPLFQQRAI